ncbi:serine/threonine-protein kinase PRP4 homolog [Papaver somniferum]|uniref:serine/threonine-protein kinase PRP4 homolog n=1 Tax=Papaver somniferum TaxID=3469 RepID=UPI000E6FDDB5|nr:serine/threonine-protein kinase PRP4 homolog [Papaver somniferum]
MKMTNKEMVKKKMLRQLPIKMKKKQSPTDKVSPSESASSLASKLQSPTKTKSAEPSLSPESRRSSPKNNKLSINHLHLKCNKLLYLLILTKLQFLQMKNKQNTQQSPTDKISPSKSASLTSKMQTPTKSKSAEPSISPESRRSSPKNKKLAEHNVEPSPNTAQLRRTPRNTKVSEPSAAVSPTKCATTPKRRRQPESAKLSSPTTKRQATRKKNFQSESARHSQSTTTKSQSKSSKGDTEIFLVGRKNEEEEENLRTRKAVEEDNSNHMEPDVEEENDNCNDDEPELENGNSSGNEEGDEGKEAKKRKYIPHGPTQMHALKLDYVDPKRTVSFNANEQPIGDPPVQLSSVLGVLVRKLPLTFRDWRRPPIQAKENIWKIVLNRFIVPECYKDYYFSKMGYYLREARSRKAGLLSSSLGHASGLFMKCREVLYKQKEQNTTKEIDRAVVWKVGHKQRKGKKPHPGVVEAFEKLEKAQAEHGDDCGSSVTDDILAKAFGEDKKTKGRLK